MAVVVLRRPYAGGRMLHVAKLPKVPKVPENGTVTDRSMPIGTSTTYVGCVSRDGCGDGGAARIGMVTSTTVLIGSKRFDGARKVMAPLGTVLTPIVPKLYVDRFPKVVKRRGMTLNLYHHVAYRLDEDAVLSTTGGNVVGYASLSRLLRV
jgi:hypothetical protein